MMEEKDFCPRINTDFHGGGWIAQLRCSIQTPDFFDGRGRTRFPLIEIGFSRMEKLETLTLSSLLPYSLPLYSHFQECGSR